MPSAHLYVHDRELIDRLKSRPLTYRQILLWATNKELAARAAERLTRAGVIAQHFDGRYSLAYGLTPRQWEVIELAAVGMPRKEIARQLGISDSTVKGHCANVIDKIIPGKDMAAAVSVAAAAGLIDIEKTYKEIRRRRQMAQGAN